MPGGVNGFGTNFNTLNSEPDHWYVKAGLRERWTSLGHTVLYGFYGQRNDMIGAGVCGRRQHHWQPDRRVGPGCGAGNRCSCHVLVAAV